MTVQGQRRGVYSGYVKTCPDCYGIGVAYSLPCEKCEERGFVLVAPRVSEGAGLRAYEARR